MKDTAVVRTSSPGVTNSPGMHPIAQHLPVGLLITPYQIIIVSISQRDTGKKSQKYPTECEVGEVREGQRERTLGIKTKRQSKRMGRNYRGGSLKGLAELEGRKGSTV